MTDDPTGLDPRVEPVEMPCDDGPVPSVDPRFPRCYRTLWGFSAGARKLGPRILKLDLDTVIVRDMTRAVSRTEDLVVWRNAHGSILGAGYLLTTGTHTHVWDDFDFRMSPALLASRYLAQSDQGWLNHTLPRSTPSFGPEMYCPPLGRTGLPAYASVVSFGRPEKPWSDAGRRLYPWIDDHYRMTT